MSDASIRSASLFISGRAAAAVLAVVCAISLAGCGGGGNQGVRAVYADQVLVKKSQRKMQLLKKGQVIKEYRIALGDNPYGHKLQEGDERTPEGDYVLDWRNPRSNYHKAIHVSYPNERDQDLAKDLGVSPGGMIMVHGMPNYVTSPVVRAEYRRRDWTNGCIAVDDPEMDEIWSLVRDGTPIRIQQ
jgi:murein L,D-transpeptidase YafK